MGQLLPRGLEGEEEEESSLRKESARVKGGRGSKTRVEPARITKNQKGPFLLTHSPSGKVSAFIPGLQGNAVGTQLGRNPRLSGLGMDLSWLWAFLGSC